ncbi:BCS1 N terminal-domain-containing protein [Pterulicium gracile]|uniref:BCS1 N terminal-domain-containing protein n=1 Tax=Pterulicium gracile TaxID=1884261 RepID=A0A5C3R353_9AGAR|nr:BCS1 N terminal-domain-containing protein [Pterula gracilis]
MGVGVGLTILRTSMTFGTTLLQRRLLVTLELNNKDPSYQWFLPWLAQHNKVGSGKSWTRSHQLSVETAVEHRKNGSSSALFNLVAGQGTHWFRYHGAWIQMKRERETKSTQAVSGIPWETVTLTTLSRDRVLFPKLLAEARDLAMRAQEGKLVVHTAWGIQWQPFGLPRRKRPLKSVVLREGVGERLEEDVRKFLDRRNWYADRGIPYRRGYLLHGPPGSGKTSFIQSLAGSMNYDICILNLSERGLTDDRLNHLLSNVPERSFILIEDVDAAFNKRVQTSEDGYQSALTFSGFLNALDGVASGEERLIFMTTNHVEKLDPALIRPGRVDLDLHLDDASPTQARRLFLQFYGGDEESEELRALADELHSLMETGIQNGQTLSMARLQGLFIQNSSGASLEGLRAFFKPPPAITS